MGWGAPERRMIAPHPSKPALGGRPMPLLEVARGRCSEDVIAHRARIVGGPRHRPRGEGRSAGIGVRAWYRLGHGW